MGADHQRRHEFAGFRRLPVASDYPVDDAAADPTADGAILTTIIIDMSSGNTASQ